MGFSLNAFLAAQSDGFAFDFTKTDRFFQENTGPTLADDVGESIGLALSSRLWNGRTLADELALQDELIVGAWTMSAAGSATATESPAGTLNLTGDGTNPGVGDNSLTTVVGRTYRIDFTTANAAHNLNIGTSQGNTSIINQSGIAAGPHSVYFVATSTTTWVRFLKTAAALATVSAISCKLVPGNHATQATGSLKPTRQVFYGYSDDQPELLVNGGFDAWTDPTVPDGWAKVGTHNGSNYVEQSPAGSLHLVSDGTYVGVSQGGLEIGKAYSVSVNVSEVSDASGAFLLGLGTDVVISAAGVYNRTIVATGTTIEIKRNASAGAVDMRIASISVKEVPASRITTAAKGDGSDDNLLTTYTAGSGENFIVAYVNVPTTISANQYVAGALSDANTRLFLGFNTSGLVRAGAGSTTLDGGGADLRGKTVVIGITTDGVNAQTFADDVEAASLAVTGSPAATTPFRIGALNNGSTAASFFSGSIEKIVVGREFLTLERYLQIRNALINQ